ncbi:hypothetical protein [Bacillus sp. FDAARGOS_1420]|uniref:hypothetical protein n=1 Tax=unclassified Bacillus (in: firmicutes) TaxID=185979 RepID=UPI001C5BB2B6|nr:hypothetical protein [Bacillus sp. FDAARGOS_1420]MBW3491829.1 hypothetical protein [Bacillus sp. FDAARGOS_1420]
MRARRYEYFVTYNWQGNSGSGSGHTTLIFTKKINKRLLEESVEFLKKKNKFKGITIQNYKLMREMRAL